MNEYKILVEIKKDVFKPLLFFNENNKIFNPCSIFNENLEENVNSQYNLTFSMSYFYIDENGKKQYNYYIDTLKIGKKVKLIKNNKTIIFIIKEISPEFHNDNLIYNYTLQDYISYSWSRLNLNYSFSTEDTGVLNIYDITRKIIEDNYIYKWAVISSDISTERITLEVDNSNPYNVLIEACNSLNLMLVVDYDNYSLSFIDKNNIKFSGYKYTINTLTDISSTYSGENLTTLLRVVGGENEYGEIISYIPPIPYFFKSIIKELGSIQGDTLIDGQKIKDIVLSGLETGRGLFTTLYNKYKNNNKYYQNQEFIKQYTIGTIPVPFYAESESDIIDGISLSNVDNEARIKEEEEIKSFMQIADLNPHLGQFMIDFSYFEKMGYLTNKEKNLINTLFYENLREANTWIKYYTEEVLQVEFRIAEIENKIKNYAESYMAEIILRNQKLNNGDINISEFYDATELAEFKSNAINLLEEYYQNVSVIYSKTDFENKLQTEYLDKEAYYVQKQTERLATYNEKYKTDEEKESIEAKALKQEIESYKTLSGWIIETDEKNIQIDSLYRTIYNWIKEGKWQIPTETTVKEKLNEWTNKGKAVNIDINRYLNSYIFESLYENTSELDSISLYNQSKIYMESLKRPTVSYNISVLDFKTLELMTVPNLTVGSKIKIFDNRIYNNYSTDSISYGNNELVVTGLSYSLRNPGEMSITVEQINNYEKLLEKILINVK